MGKTKAKAATKFPPLAEGQFWRVGELQLQVEKVGPHLVHYKLAKPDAVRVPKITHGKTTVEAYLKRTKAVLIKG
jgi:hypothetical protein